MSKRLISLLLACLVALMGMSAAFATEDKPYKIKIMGIWSEMDQDNPGYYICKIAREFCEQNPGYTFEYEYCEQFETASRMSILISSNDMPDIFAYEPGGALDDMIKLDAIVDLSEDLPQLGYAIEDVLSPATMSAASLMSADGHIWQVPSGIAIEGIWYNKALFEQNGLEVPETWAELEALCDQLLALGIQPIALPNDAQFQMTRWLMLYQTRLGGHDVHLKAAMNDGISFRDPLFVEGARAIQEMCQKGYFGQGVNSLTPDDAYAMFLNGQAAMHYNGSWVIKPFSSGNAEAGELTSEQIGLFNAPYIEGSPISAEVVDGMYAVFPTVGLCFSKDKYEAGTNNAFLKYFIDNYGNEQVEAGMVTAYNPDFLDAEFPEEHSPLIDLHAQVLEETKESALWYEAMMDTAVSQVALENGQLLAEGSMTPEEYCEALASAVDDRFA